MSRQIQVKRPTVRKPPAPLDQRTPSGKPLPNRAGRTWAA